MSDLPTSETVQMAKAKALSHVFPGWAPLVEEFYDRFPQAAQAESVLFWDKWGSLRCKVPLELLNQFPGLGDFIEEMESRSETMCEVCGGPGNPRGKGWVHTLCDGHTLPSLRVEFHPDEEEFEPPPRVTRPLPDNFPERDDD